MNLCDVLRCNMTNFQTKITCDRYLSFLFKAHNFFLKLIKVHIPMRHQIALTCHHRWKESVVSCGQRYLSFFAFPCYYEILNETWSIFGQIWPMSRILMLSWMTHLPTWNNICVKALRQWSKSRFYFYIDCKSYV